MAKYLRFGSFHKNSKYIFILIFCKILTNSFFGLTYNSNYKSFKLIKIKDQGRLSKHSTIYTFLCYLMVLILSGIVYMYERKVTKSDSLISRNTDRTSTLSSIILIHNDGNPDLLKKSPQIVLLIFFIWITSQILISIYYKIGLRDLDFWMLELLIISYLNSKMFKLETYNHQKVAIYFNVIICSIFKLSSFLISFFQEHSLYYKYAYLIPIGIFVYLIIIFLRAYSINKLKWLMDLKYIAPSKLIMISGLIGTVMNLIVCIVSTYIKCLNVEFGQNLCKVSKFNFKVEDNNPKEKYYENFFIYFEDLSHLDTTDISLEIISFLLGSICYFFYYFFYILVVKYLTPVHLSFTNSIYYFFVHILLFIMTDKNESAFNYSKFWVDILSESLSFIGFLIYLEIIELHFCGLYHDLKIYIIRRSIKDKNGNFPIDDTSIIDESPEKDNDNIFNSDKKVSELVQEKNNL